MDFLIFEPIYKERVWGGTTLSSFFNRKLPENKRIGESWELVDRKDDQSVVAYGPLKGRTIHSLLEEFPEEIMGPFFKKGQPFPVLVKWLDCQERLSLQVHPPAEIAKKINGEPKTENWYIVDSKKDAAVLVGFNEIVDQDQFMDKIENGSAKECICRIETKPGDSFFIPSGRIHAIDAGNLILEIQQNSDTTYRVYDWGRLGLDGAPRELHVEKSLQSIDFQDIKPSYISKENGRQLLVDAPEFRLEKIDLSAGESISFKKKEETCIVSLVCGILSHTKVQEISMGTNILIPYESESIFTAKTDTTLLLTNSFTKTPRI